MLVDGPVSYKVATQTWWFWTHLPKSWREPFSWHQDMIQATHSNSGKTLATLSLAFQHDEHVELWTMADYVFYACLGDISFRSYRWYIWSPINPEPEDFQLSLALLALPESAFWHFGSFGFPACCVAGWQDMQNNQNMQKPNWSNSDPWHGTHGHQQCLNILSLDVQHIQLWHPRSDWTRGVGSPIL